MDTFLNEYKKDTDASVSTVLRLKSYINEISNIHQNIPFTTEDIIEYVHDKETICNGINNIDYPDISIYIIMIGIIIIVAIIFLSIWSIIFIVLFIPLLEEKVCKRKDCIYLTDSHAKRILKFI